MNFDFTEHVRRRQLDEPVYEMPIFSRELYKRNIHLYDHTIGGGSGCGTWLSDPDTGNTYKYLNVVSGDGQGNLPAGDGRGYGDGATYPFESKNPSFHIWDSSFSGAFRIP